MRRPRGYPTLHWEHRAPKLERNYLPLAPNFAKYEPDGQRQIGYGVDVLSSSDLAVVVCVLPVVPCWEVARSRYNRIRERDFLAS